MINNKLERLYAELLARRVPADRTGCPGPEKLRALVERTGPESTRLSLLDHAMACESCRRDFELLRAAATAAARPRSRRRFPAGLAAAAVFVLFIGGSLVWQFAGGETGSDTMRGAERAVRVVEPRGVVSGRLTELVWHEYPGAARYLVEVMTEDGRVILSAGTRDTTFAVPDSARFVRGAEYIWWVETFLLDGGRVRSEPRRFTISP